MRIGSLLIGQAPRADYDLFLRACLPPEAEVLAVGALDDLTLAEIQALPCRKGEDVLTTLSREAVPIVVAADEIHRRMPAKVEFLERNGCDMIVVICTGEFPFLSSRVPLILPSRILTRTVAAVAEDKKISLLLPLAEQFEQLGGRWATAGLKPVCHAVSPYTQPEALWSTGRSCAAEDTALVVMDCMGYTQAMKDTLRQASGKPVVAARTILARVIAELAE